MAVDKLVDSSQLNADLTSVANAIRTKGGTSGSLAFPNGFVNAIDAIQTGGGGAPYEVGTVTIASDTQTLTVSVTQLYTRFIVCRFDKYADWTYPASGLAIVFVYGSASEYTVCDTNNSGGSIRVNDRTPSWRDDKISFTASQITVKALGNGAVGVFPTGSTYVWAAW